MSEAIPVNQIYDHNINLLLGSGASFGLLPTLALGMRKPDGLPYSLEELATYFETFGDDRRHRALFMHYYYSCIRPAQHLSVQSSAGNPAKELVFKNYVQLLETLIRVLQRRKGLDRRCNVFTTNYDGCIPLAADIILRRGDMDFVINDGTRGFSQRLLQARNFNTYFCQTGIFERHQASVPQINLIHLHGSVYWRKLQENIVVDYRSIPDEQLIEIDGSKLTAFSSVLSNEEATLDDLLDPPYDNSELESFWSKYSTLPIVNPTKWKFHETVFDEHYYQMLRLLSYELEKPNAILVTFGFSFADEHIRNLILRSLSNPLLQVFICCFNSAEKTSLTDRFQGFANVKLIGTDGLLDFTTFNRDIFTLNPALQKSDTPLHSNTFSGENLSAQGVV